MYLIASEAEARAAFDAILGGRNVFGADNGAVLVQEFLRVGFVFLFGVGGCFFFHFPWHIYARIGVCILTETNTHTQMCVCVYIHLNAYVCVYLPKHTHTHTHMQGTEYVVDSVSKDGEHRVCCFWEYDKVRLFVGVR